MPAGRPKKQDRPLTKLVTLRLNDEEYDELCRLAADRFQKPAELARVIIQRTLAAQRRKQKSS